MKFSRVKAGPGTHRLRRLIRRQRLQRALPVAVADAAVEAGGAGRLLRQRMWLVHRLQILSKQMPPRRQQFLILPLRRRAVAALAAVAVAVAERRGQSLVRPRV